MGGMAIIATSLIAGKVAERATGKVCSHFLESDEYDETAEPEKLAADLIVADPQVKSGFCKVVQKEVVTLLPKTDNLLLSSAAKELTKRVTGHACKYLLESDEVKQPLQPESIAHRVVAAPAA
jgi:hypothetical protein